MSSYSFSFTPFLHIEDEYGGVNDFDPSGTSEDTFNLLADDTQSFVLNEEESLSEFFENNYEKVENIEPLYSIKPDMTFLKNHRLEQGFAFTITYSDKDKDDGFPQCHIYACSKDQIYNQQKKVHTNENRNRGHNINNCKFHINAYHRKKDNLIHITKVEGENNHELVENIRIVFSYYRKLTPEMRDDIALLATCEMRAGAIIEVL
ncbi:16229_t:CDS:2 [Funneliformis mosseae]|uniref:16229_t:CDS:1 n=1 Tax=Funneliformis mosseae TaxID=27381 RepID=A0A9N9A0Z3_FUNMO|nr:16229_t:CDS:2 [Funneliformis mosseae]